MNTALLSGHSDCSGGGRCVAWLQQLTRERMMESVSSVAAAASAAMTDRRSPEQAWRHSIGPYRVSVSSASGLVFLPLWPTTSDRRVVSRRYRRRAHISSHCAPFDHHASVFPWPPTGTASSAAGPISLCEIRLASYLWAVSIILRATRL